ncbi:MAG: HEAT repeat domain-containing protein [Bacteroidetes bacterium]|nr:HEAT repeat domain-containing protein [Bacteroidota bacterium]
MSFYELSKVERVKLVEKISKELLAEINSSKFNKTISYFSDEDTYIRKSAYLSIGRIYFSENNLQKKIVKLLDFLLKEEDFKIRQTTINAAGEIGKMEFGIVKYFFDTGLFDAHHSVRNAVIGSVKKMGEVNPKPVLEWAKAYLHHPDKEIRREICHGIELRGRTHPLDILPLLKELQYDKTLRVSKTLVHVLGQIAYKKGCLEIVVEHLKTWENKQLVQDALEEIIDVHNRYKDFAIKTQEQAIQYIAQHYPQN